MNNILMALSVLREVISLFQSDFLREDNVVLHFKNPLPPLFL